MFKLKFLRPRYETKFHKNYTVLSLKQIAIILIAVKFGLKYQNFHIGFGYFDSTKIELGT